MFRSILIATACCLLTACGDPLAGVARLTDSDIDQSDAAPAALPTDEEIAREGFFGTSAATGAEVPPEIAEAEAPRARGILGLFRRGASADEATVDPQADAIAAAVRDSAVPTAEAETSLAAPTVAAETQEASLAPQEDTLPAAAPKRRGFLGRLLPSGSGKKTEAPKPRTGPDAQDVAMGTALPFGQVARVCDARGKNLGRRVEKAPANGYVLYDSSPDSAAPRTFYITGFDDGCPRQLTAANVILGSASRYEQFRYGPTGVDLPVGATDEAYEDIKWRICSAGRGRPCGSQMKKMDRSTFFVSAYASFSNARTWKEMLIHDGAVLAAAVKTNG